MVAQKKDPTLYRRKSVEEAGFQTENYYGSESIRENLHSNFV